MADKKKFRAVSPSGDRKDFEFETGERQAPSDSSSAKSVRHDLENSQILDERPFPRSKGFGVVAEMKEIKRKYPQGSVQRSKVRKSKKGGRSFELGRLVGSVLVEIKDYKSWRFVLYGLLCSIVIGACVAVIRLEVFSNNELWLVVVGFVVLWLLMTLLSVIIFNGEELFDWLEELGFFRILLLLVTGCFVIFTIYGAWKWLMPWVVDLDFSRVAKITYCVFLGLVYVYYIFVFVNLVVQNDGDDIAQEIREEFFSTVTGFLIIPLLAGLLPAIVAGWLSLILIEWLAVASSLIGCFVFWYLYFRIANMDYEDSVDSNESQKLIPLAVIHIAVIILSYFY